VPAQEDSSLGKTGITVRLRKDPQRDQQPGIGGVAAHVSLDRLDFTEPRLQVERADCRPDDPRRMVGFEQIVEGFPAHLNLIADGYPQPRLARRHRLGSLGARRWFGQVVWAKEGKRHGAFPATYGHSDVNAAV